MSQTPRLLAALLFVALGLAGLWMSLCGGYFTALALADLLSTVRGREGGWGVMILFIALPSLVIGALAVRLAWREVPRLLGK